METSKLTAFVNKRIATLRKKHHWQKGSAGSGTRYPKKQDMERTCNMLKKQGLSLGQAFVVWDVIVKKLND